MLVLYKYMAMLKIKVIETLHYIYDVLGRSFFYILIIGIMTMLWSTIYGEQGKTIIEGFTLPMMIWYLVVTELITLSSVHILQVISEEVKGGQIAYILTKPYSYIGYHMSSYAGATLVRLAINSVLALAIGLTLVGPLSGYNIFNTPMILLSILLGMTLDFFINLCLSLTAFWVEENSPFRWIYQKLVFTLGGMLMPLELFPTWLYKFSKYLPFGFVTYGPAKLAVNFSIGDFLEIILFQCIYIGVFLGIAVFMYKKGVKVLHVNGG